MNKKKSHLSIENMAVDNLTKEEAKRELLRLSKLIFKHNELYHTKNNPAISDAEYDNLYTRNLSIEKCFPDLAGCKELGYLSPSKNVGSAVNKKFKKIKHKIPMLSLSNAFSAKDIEDFINRLNKFLNFSEDKNFIFLCEPKIDGLSFTAQFQEGILNFAATRGDGKHGEDITRNIKTIKNFPLEIKDKNLPKIFEVRGEVYISHSEFNKLNEECQHNKKPLFSNPRNAAAGSLRQLDPNITASRNLKYFVYSIGEATDFTWKSQEEANLFLKKLGFITNKLNQKCSNLEEIIEYYKNIENYRHNLDYDIDGCVYKINDISLQKRLGYLSNSPRWAIAHKFSPEKGKTIIEEIIIQVSRLGKLSPVAILKPVTIGGVVISRVSLHNEDEINRKDIRVGDIAILHRAGDVIPQILEIDLKSRKPNSKKYIFPEKCPVCAGSVIRENEKSATYCLGSFLCSAQVLGKLEHLVSREAFNIEGLGTKQLKFLLEKNIIKKASDIFSLEERNKKKSLNTLEEKTEFSEISEFKGWGEKSCNNLFKSINEKRSVSLKVFIYSLGIQHIGNKAATLIEKHYISFENFKQDMNNIYNNYHTLRNKLLSELKDITDSNIRDILTTFYIDKDFLNLLDNQENTYQKLISTKGITENIAKTILISSIEKESSSNKFLEKPEEKEIENLLKSISSSLLKKQNILYNKILKIHNISKKTAGFLMLFFLKENSYIHMFKKKYNLMNIDGIGKKTIESLVLSFINRQFFEEFEELSNLLNIKSLEEQKDSPHADKKIVFTGKLSKISRSEAKNMAENAGMIVCSSVSKNIDYVIAGENSGSKFNKAKLLNLSILTEDEWLQILSL